MILATVCPGLFNGHQVVGILHHADQVAAAAPIGADRAGGGLGKDKAPLAEPDGTMKLGKAPGQRQGLAFRMAKDIEGKPGCGFTANAGKTAEILNQSIQGRGDDMHY